MLASCYQGVPGCLAFAVEAIDLRMTDALIVSGALNDYIAIKTRVGR